jgi:hypothetical protein
VLLTVREPLVAARELLELLLDLELLRQYALLDLQDLSPAVGELSIDFASQLDGLLAGLDLRLTAYRFPFPSRVLEQLLPDAAGLRDSRRAEHGDGEQSKGGASGDPDGDSDPDQHVPAPRSRTQPPLGGTPHPAPGLAGSYPRSLIRRAAARRRSPALPRA